MDHSLQHLGQIDFDMLTHELQTRIKVYLLVLWALVLVYKKALLLGVL